MFDARPQNSRRTFREIMIEAATQGSISVWYRSDGDGTPQVSYSVAMRTRTGREIHRDSCTLNWRNEYVHDGRVTVKTGFYVYGGSRARCGVRNAVQVNAKVTCEKC